MKPPLVLAIDTTSEFASLALVEGEEVREEMVLHSPDGFAHLMFDPLEALLKRSSVRLAEIDCIAAAAGPGSFTGVRVCLAAAKGLAEAAGKPVAPVSNLRAIASCGSREPRAAILDARRGEIYGAVYDARGEAVRAECVMKFGEWLETLPHGEIEFVSPTIEVFAPMLRGICTAAPRALAGAVGRIGAEEYCRGRAVDAVVVDANYVRRSDAELLMNPRKTGR